MLIANTIVFDGQLHVTACEREKILLKFFVDCVPSGLSFSPFSSMNKPFTQPGSLWNAGLLERFMLPCLRKALWFGFPVLSLKEAYCGC